LISAPESATDSVRRGIREADAYGIREGPPALIRVKPLTFNEIRNYSAPFVSDTAREHFEAGLQELFNRKI
jgi:hypothetical protein